MTKYLLNPSLCFILILFSCKPSETKVELKKMDDFPASISMNNYLKNSYETSLMLNPRFNIIDSIIVVLDKKFTDGFIRIFDSRTLKLISSFGKIGRGPNEYIDPAYIQVDKKRRQIWFIDYPKTTFYCFNLKDALASDNPPAIHSFSFDRNLMPIFNYHFMKNGNILIPTTTDTCLYTEITKRGEISKTYGVLKEPRKNMSQMEYNYFYYRNIAYNEDLNIAVGTYTFLDKIMCYNLNNNSTSYYLGSKYEEIEPEVGGGNVFNNWQSYTLQICSTKDFVFASYLGDEYTLADYSANYPTEIHVFDWNMKPTAKLLFPDPIIKFDINEQGEIFVFANTTEKPFQVYQLDLNALK